MANLIVRPDLKTVGGETGDILLNGRFIGTFTLVYRENDRVSGSVQLEKKSLSAADKEEVELFLTQYIQSFTDAVNADECSVVVTYSSYEHIVNAEEIETAGETDVEEEFEETESIADDEEDAVGYYELVAVNETPNSVHYHVYDEQEEWLVEAFLDIEQDRVEGEIHWVHEPSEEEIDEVTELIVSDFDSNQIDHILLEHYYDQEILTIMELDHESLVSEDGKPDSLNGKLDDDYLVVLIRDDGDTLTYEIYQQSRGALPIGTATIDLGSRQLTGFIDFREPEHARDSEEIAALLLNELDKEQDYESLSLTMLSHNKTIEEMYIESAPVH
ncbi:hypothetical protein [Paenibacillus sp. J2TS4]|uniref:hypothetical protein n=1 Tax=Paenibacillus sp. J2TS4 TaxID=2807194 RepID=UPI001B2B61FF|nr:hypothetical protein [Paenibacillus sp. J2TS4]GIP33922.1 hypothetical protein J2TS4_31320 [Paenibacillus sp. J2TS4]